MPITLTHTVTAEVVTIGAVLGYDSDAPVPTNVHTVLGRGTPDFTLRPAGPRTGTFELWCADETAALNLARVLKVPGALALADTVTNIADTTFMVTGPVRVSLDMQTQLRCIVSVQYTGTTA